jgi:hypothetical protein
MGVAGIATLFWPDDLSIIYKGERPDDVRTTS